MDYTYDSLGRLGGMTQYHQTQGRTLTWVNNVIYGAANELKQIHYLATIGDQVQTFDGYMRETRTYNNRLQMTRMQVIWPFASLPGLDQEYRYSATADNGQITQRKDYAPGADEITYQYDSLNRLISATTTGPEWDLSFSYDGFGNRTGQNVTKGSAPVMNLTYNDQTNRVNPGHGFVYDNNGNTLNMPGLSMTYDYDNRLTSATQSSNGTEYYNYSPDIKRIWKKSVQSSGTIEFFYCYGADGRKIGRYQVSTVFWGGQYRLTARRSVPRRRALLRTGLDQMDDTSRTENRALAGRTKSQTGSECTTAIS